MLNCFHGFPFSVLIAVLRIQGWMGHGTEKWTWLLLSINLIQRLIFLSHEKYIWWVLERWMYYFSKRTHYGRLWNFDFFNPRNFIAPGVLKPPPSKQTVGIREQFAVWDFSVQSKVPELKWYLRSWNNGKPCGQNDSLIAWLVAFICPFFFSRCRSCLRRKKLKLFQKNIFKFSLPSEKLFLV